jgi:factor associated with neutral sphingomyelinase activation
VIEMKRNGCDHQYVFRRASDGVPAKATAAVRAAAAHTCVLSLQYQSLANFLPRVMQLRGIEMSPDPDVADALLADALESGEASQPFDQAWIQDMGETTLHTARVVRIKPLREMPGRLVVTNARVYYQPFNKVTVTSPFKMMPLRDCAGVRKRRHTLREVGVELFIAQAGQAGGGGPGSAGGAGGAGADSVLAGVGGYRQLRTFFFVFSSLADRDRAFSAITLALGTLALTSANAAASAATPPAAALLPRQPHAMQHGVVTPDSVISVSMAWSCGSVSNYDYLM